MGDKFLDKRNELRAISLNSNLSLEERMTARRKLFSLPKNSAPSRLRNRCAITGRPRGYIRFFGLSRIAFREMALNGELPGIRKGSLWTRSFNLPVTDPISDMLSRIRNAIMVHHNSVPIPASRTKESLLKLLVEEGFISSFTKREEGSKTFFDVVLRYYDDSSSVISGLKRISKPGLRVYSKRDEIPRYLGGLGVAFLSTPKGIMTGYNAKKQGIGGELLFFVW